MSTMFRLLQLSLISSLALSCGGQAADAESQSALQGEDEGTALSATAAHASSACQRTGTSASVSFDLTLTSSGSVDSAEVWMTADAAAARKVALVEPHDFVGDGRTKTASFTLTTTLTSGAHSVTYCFVESGAQGREPKETCAEPVAVEVSCGPDAPTPSEDAGHPSRDAGEVSDAPRDAGTSPDGDAGLVCDAPAFFGDLTDRTSLCGPSDPSSIAIRAHGDFGPGATVRIEAPNGCVLEGPMRRPDACTAAFNWAAATEHSGPGNYTFTVRGNGKSVSTTRYLNCPR